MLRGGSHSEWIEVIDVNRPQKKPTTTATPRPTQKLGHKLELTGWLAARAKFCSASRADFR
jgi:hypothetical protein